MELILYHILKDLSMSFLSFFGFLNKRRHLDGRRFEVFWLGAEPLVLPAKLFFAYNQFHKNRCL